MSKQRPIIGCLALQGAVELHRSHVEACGAEFRAVKTPAQFEEVDGFILPGGESTTMLNLIERFDLWDVLAEQFAKKPVWGICAGSILMAEKVLYQKASSPRQSEALLKQRGSSDARSRAAHLIDPVCASASDEARQRDDIEWNTQKSFGLLPITVQRNGYGRQIDSHHALIDGYEVSLIRAPVITNYPPPQSSPLKRGEEERESVQEGGFEILALHDDTPVWVKRGPYMASTFHPELTQDFPSPMHRAFVDLVGESA